MWTLKNHLFRLNSPFINSQEIGVIQFSMSSFFDSPSQDHRPLLFLLSDYVFHSIWGGPKKMRKITEARESRHRRVINKYECSQQEQRSETTFNQFWLGKGFGRWAKWHINSWFEEIYACAKQKAKIYCKMRIETWVVVEFWNWRGLSACTKREQKVYLRNERR